MSFVSIRGRVALAVLVVLPVTAFAAAPAMAEGTTTACMPYAVSTGKLATGKPIVAGTESGTCKNTTSIHYHPLNLPSGAGFETLNKMLSHMTFIESGVGGKPTIEFSGVNIQLVNGEGKTASANGAGNLVLGYDENEGKHEQTGSHDLILGSEQTFTSYGGLLAGFKNSATAPWASASGGYGNIAGNELASVSGGELNTASGADSSVSGGIGGKASGTISSISGGKEGKAQGSYSSVGGGYLNLAGGELSSASGGYSNDAEGSESSVSGGVDNFATGRAASVTGGFLSTAKGEESWVGGGYFNRPEGRLTSVFGGEGVDPAAELEACGGHPGLFC